MDGMAAITKGLNVFKISFLKKKAKSCLGILVRNVYSTSTVPNILDPREPTEAPKHLLHSLAKCKNKKTSYT